MVKASYICNTKKNKKPHCLLVARHTRQEQHSTGGSLYMVVALTTL
jgi:hypothetical protein